MNSIPELLPVIQEVDRVSQNVEFPVDLYLEYSQRKSERNPG